MNMHHSSKFHRAENWFRWIVCILDNLLGIWFTVWGLLILFGISNWRLFRAIPNGWLGVLILGHGFLAVYSGVKLITEKSPISLQTGKSRHLIAAALSGITIVLLWLALLIETRNYSPDGVGLGLGMFFFTMIFGSVTGYFLFVASVMSWLYKTTLTSNSLKQRTSDPEVKDKPIESRQSYITIRVGIILGSIEFIGSLLWIVAGAGIYGSPFGRGNMSFTGGISTIILLLTGPMWLLPASLLSLYKREIASHIMFLGAILSCVASYFLSSTFMNEGFYWWELALGFKVFYFLLFSFIFSGPLLVIGIIIHQDEKTRIFLTRKQAFFFGGTLFLILLCFILTNIYKPFHQQLAKSRIEDWGGTVVIGHYHFFPEQSYYVRRYFHPDPIISEEVQIDLSKAKFKSNSLGILSDIGNVTSMNMTNKETNDQAMEYIAPLTGITYLNLLNTQISDAGLKHLHDLKQLENLNLYGTDTTRGGRLELQKRLPKCMIYPPDNIQPRITSNTSDNSKSNNASVGTAIRSDKAAISQGFRGKVYYRKQPKDKMILVPNASIVFIHKENNERRVTFSDEHGKYQIELEKGKYQVLATHEDYFPFQIKKGFVLCDGKKPRTYNIFFTREKTTHPDKLNTN